ncbi:MAG TPA: hypothetical protein P5257_00655 [Bacteroidales bacterium]|nr:hypothetical protein [Bacteroidales bacterium]HRT88603.1 hypothetical protein [Bacteroidales bacterium]
MMSELDKIPKENPFRVPDGYFEGITGRIMQAASNEPRFKAAEKKIFRLRPWMAAAAGLAIITALSITFLLISPGREKMDIYTDLSFNGTAEEIFYGMDLSALEEEAAGRISTSGFIGVENSDIIEYLQMQNINILDIYEYF